MNKSMNAIDNQPCHSYHDTDPISFEDFCLFVKERKKKQNKKKSSMNKFNISKIEIVYKYFMVEITKTMKKHTYLDLGEPATT